MPAKTIIIFFLLLSAFHAFPQAIETGDALEGKIIKEIRVSPLKYTKREMVIRALNSKAGEPFRKKNIREDLERLDRLGFFRAIHISAVEEDNEVVLLVEVHETFPYLPTVSLDYNQENGFSIGPGLKSTNLFHTNLSLSSGARFGGETQLEVLTGNPWLPDGNWVYKVHFLYMDRWNSFNAFNEDSVDINFFLGRTIGGSFTAGGRGAFFTLRSDTDGITLSDTNRDNIPYAGAFFVFDTRDLWSNPHHGWRNEVDVDKAGGALGGDADFWETNIDLRRYQPIAERHTLALFSLTTLRTGRIGVDIPEYLEFYIGGTNTVRGWNLGSRHGKNQMLNTIEYHYMLMKPRPWKVSKIAGYLGLQLAAFGDFGIAWTEGREFAASNFIDGYGVGLRLVIPWVELLRFDVGFGEPGTGLHFQFGIYPKADKQRQRVR